LKVRILNGLQLFFEEVRILKDLTQSELKIESLESKGIGQDAEKSERVASLAHVFLNTEGAESTETEELGGSRAVRADW
jgi:hypothetical protein